MNKQKHNNPWIQNLKQVRKTVEKRPQWKYGGFGDHVKIQAFNRFLHVEIVDANHRE